MNQLLIDKKAIIFDLGNVIIDLHYDRTAQIIQDLTGLTPTQQGDLLVTSDVLKRFEVGGISEADFRKEMCDLLKVEMDDEHFDEMWNALLGDISSERIRKLMELNGYFTTMILSNTNSIHERRFNFRLDEQHGYADLSQLVDHVFLSHDIQLRKPGGEIYEYVLKETGFSAEEVLFIDDRQDNIDGAASIGIDTFLNEKVDSWLDVL